MHVALFGAFPPPYGGIQTHIVALRAFLQSRGVRCSVVTTTRHKSAVAEDVFHPHSTGDVLRVMKRLGADIWHVHLGGIPRPREFGLCVACSLMPNSRSILTLHSGGYPSSPQGRSARRASVTGAALRSLDHLIAVNQEIATVFHKYGVSASRTSVIEPHSPGLAPVALELPAALTAFVAAHDPLLLTVGLLEPEYNLDFQLAILPEIRRHYPSAGLAIIGSGSLEERLRDQRRRSPVANHIGLWGDVPHAQTLAVINKAAALLRLTSYDGDAISIREALHFGTPVVATDTGLRPEGVHLVRQLAENDVISSLTAALSSPRVRDSASPTNDNLERILEVYRSVLGTRPGAG